MLKEIRWDFEEEDQLSIMDQIQRLSRERQELWFKAGSHDSPHMSEEDRLRIEEITAELARLWDMERRRRVAARHNRREEKRRREREWTASMWRGAMPQSGRE